MRMMQWIDSLESRLPAILTSFAAGIVEKMSIAAEDNLKKCRLVKRRMSEGVALLKSDEDVFEAFCLANQAMSATMRRSRPADLPKWFPFQIAFLLMALPSAVNAVRSDRTVMDLIWFPTGGGKTEAYLGLVSIVLFHRRIVGKGKQDHRERPFLLG